jgi:hypothetical protein
MQTDDLKAPLQEPITCPYPESDQSSPTPHYFS